MASQSIFTTSASAIVTRTLHELSSVDAPSHSRPKPSNLVRIVNRQRQKTRPAEPRGDDYELAHDYLTQHTPDFLLRDLECRLTGRRHLIFMTDHQRDLLSKTKTWYMDGTFRVVNEPFDQLFTIHGFIRSEGDMKQVPLAFCFMSGRRTDDYYEVLRAIDRYLPSIRLERCVMDFEAGLWRAVRERFPDVDIRGCSFHWTQAIYRKIQEYGLQNAYYKKGNAYDFLKQLLSLHVLPPEHIPGTFNILLDRASTDSIMQLMDYVNRTWITSRTFPSESWSTYNTAIRTNNDVEGWHNGLNARVNSTPIT